MNKTLVLTSISLQATRGQIISTECSKCQLEVWTGVVSTERSNQTNLVVQGRLHAELKPELRLRLDSVL